MTTRMTRMDVEVLITLPKVPHGCNVPEIAEVVMGKTDSPSLGVVRRTLRRFRSLLYVETVSTRPYGRKDIYGIRADKWRCVQAMLKEQTAARGKSQ